MRRIVNFIFSILFLLFEGSNHGVRCVSRLKWLTRAGRFSIVIDDQQAPNLVTANVSRLLQWLGFLPTDSSSFKVQSLRFRLCHRSDSAIPLTEAPSVEYCFNCMKSPLKKKDRGGIFVLCGCE